jgi:hypothetical protein
VTGFRGSGDQLGTRRVVPDPGRDNVREHDLEPDEPGEPACEVGWVHSWSSITRGSVVARFGSAVESAARGCVESVLNFRGRARW